MQYKFRGKRKDNGEWVIGFYASSPDLPFNDIKEFIIEFIGIESGEPIFEWHEVIPETVGMFTGLLDEHGNEIYQGDKLRGMMGEQETENRSPITSTVRLKQGGFEVFTKAMSRCILGRFTWCDHGYHGNRDVFRVIEKFEVVGNIHEVNPASGQSGVNYMQDPNLQQQEAAGQAAEAVNEQATTDQVAAVEQEAQEQAMESAEEGTTEG